MRRLSRRSGIARPLDQDDDYHDNGDRNEEVQITPVQGYELSLVMVSSLVTLVAAFDGLGTVI